MAFWEGLYSVLKMTREGKDNRSMEDEAYKEMIIESITIKDIEEMDGQEVKEAVISYLQVLVPGIKNR